MTPPSSTACSTTKPGPRARGTRHLDVLQPAARPGRTAAHPGLGGLRRQGDLLRLQVPRSRAGEDQDLHQPPRQRVERRLGRRQPGFEPGGTNRVPHVHQSERHPDGRAAKQQRGYGRRLGMAERRARGRRRLDCRGAAPAREHPVPWRIGRAHGRAVLPAQQPPGHVVVVAGHGSGRVGLREPRAAGVRRAAPAALARSHSERDGLAQRVASAGAGLAGPGAKPISAPA